MSNPTPTPDRDTAITVDADTGTMSSPATSHTARRLEGGGWVVSWLPSVRLTEVQARNAIRIAVLVTLPAGDPRRCVIVDFAKSLDVAPDDAIARASVPVGTAVPPRLEAPRPETDTAPAPAPASVPVPAPVPAPAPVPTPASVPVPVPPASPVPVAAPSAGLAAALVEAHTATMEAFAIPADLTAGAARKLLAVRQDAVRMLLALDRPGLTAEGLLYDIARLREEIARTDREIVEVERARAAARAARAAERRAAKEADAAPVPPIQADAEMGIEDRSAERPPPLRPVTPLHSRRPMPAGMLFDRVLLEEALAPRTVDLLGRLTAHHVDVKARWSA
jgi:hypothetical protein